jgi:hypothetical protein
LGQALLGCICPLGGQRLGPESRKRVKHVRKRYGEFIHARIIVKPCVPEVSSDSPCFDYDSNAIVSAEVPAIFGHSTGIRG